MVNRLKFSLVITLIVFFSACSNYPSKKDLAFGSSVKSLVKGQVYDTATLSRPPSDVIMGLDSNKAIGDMNKVYRSIEVSKQQTKIIGNSNTGQ